MAQAKGEILMTILIYLTLFSLLLFMEPSTVSDAVRHWSERGILKSYRIGPLGDRRFRREDMDDFLKEREIVTYER